MKNSFGVVHAGAVLWFADVCAMVLEMGSTQMSEGMKVFLWLLTPMQTSSAIKHKRY
jgi:acyl-coenzyme A thioesterase PaaI-like protein